MKAYMEIRQNKPLFEYYPPKNQYIGIVSIPHSGETIPPEFLDYLVSETKDLMQDVDFRVHELVDIEQLQAAGIAVIKSNIIRVAVDLNRAQNIAVLNWKKNSKGVQIVTKEVSEQVAKQFLAKYYLPYYEMLKTLINELEHSMKSPSFIDLHSMPGKAEEYHLKINPNQEIYRPDLCLSDVNGESCSPDFIQKIQASLKENFQKVTLNDPYFGGNITREIHQKFPHINNIQIEINRSTYMNEENKELIKSGVKKHHKYLTASIIELCQNFSSL